MYRGGALHAFLEQAQQPFPERGSHVLFLVDDDRSAGELEVAAELPKTRSGKIMRRLLKARELGLPEGDTSTLLRPEAP